jgi:hypothetical protein
MNKKLTPAEYLAELDKIDELSPDAGNYDAEPAFQCGLFCGVH